MSNLSAIKDWVERDQRRGVKLTAMAFRADGSHLAVTLRNISYDGCLLEAEAGSESEPPFSIGEKLTLALPRMGEVRAQVRWATSDGRAGARFVIEEVFAQAPRSASGL